MDIEYWDAIAETYGADVAQGMLGDRPRPTKPSAPEWDGEGLPPVGCECEVRNPFGDWHQCSVVGRHLDRAVFFCYMWTDDSDYDALPASGFRPLRTKEQRQRGELIELIGKQRPTIAELADAILSHYNLEPKK